MGLHERTDPTTGAFERPDVPWRLGWGPTWLDRALVALLLGGVLVWIVVGPITKCPRHIDEGLHAVAARFFLLDPSEHVARPDYHVGGWLDWKEGAQALLLFPPVPDAVYGLSIGLFGLNSVGFGAPLLLAGLLTALALFLLGRRLWDRTTGLAAAALFLWSAAGIREGSQLEAEPFVAALGALAVALVAEGTARRRWWWFAASGAAFGGAFLMKLYMGLFPGFVALGFFVRSFREDRFLRVVGRWGLLLLVTAFVGCVHLLYVAIAHPDDLAVWQFVYLRSLVERAGVPGDAPIWYYPGVLYRDYAAFVIPFLWATFEFIRGWRRRDADESARRWLYATTFLGFAALFAFSKKESAYLFPLAPFLLLLTGRGFVGLARFAIDPKWRPRALWLGAIVCLIAVVAILVAWFSDFRTTGFDGLFVLLHTVAFVTLAAALLYWRVGPPRVPARIAVTVLAAVAVAWGGVSAVHVIRDHRNAPLQATAEALLDDPRVADEARPPDGGDRTETFVSSYWQPLSVFLWQRGRPWYWGGDRDRPWEEQALRLSPTIRFFQIDREYRSCDGCPPTPGTHAAILDWLRRNAEDVTSPVEASVGRPLRTYVFRRRAVAANHRGPGAFGGIHP